MSIYGLTELLIHFHCFRNIDLTNQGLYQIRVKLHYTDKNAKYYAVPYHYNTSKENEEINKKEDKGYNLYNLIAPHTNETNNEYISKSFYIRFSDEEVEIDDFCYFRFEIPVNYLSSQNMYNLEFELHYSDSLYTLNKDKNAIATQSQMISDNEFKPVNNQIVVLNFDKESYIESYIPIVYSDNFSSMLNLTIQMANLDMRLRIDQPIFVIEDEKSKKIIKSKGSVKNDKTFSFYNFFEDGSEESQNTQDIDLKIAEELYEKFVIPLIKNYKIIKTKYLKYSSVIIDDAIKSEFSFFTNVLPLSIYFEEDDKIIINIDELTQNIDSKLLRFTQRIDNFSKEYIANRLLSEINHISAQLFQLWHKYIDFIRYFPKNYNFILAQEYNSKYQDDMIKFVKRTIMNVNENTNLIYQVESNTGDLNKNQVGEIRSYLTDFFTRTKVEILNHLIKPSIFPILFEETYIKQVSNNDQKPVFLIENENNFLMDESFDNTNKKFSPSLHLLILVHGFQGNSYDMRLIKNNISIINPSCVFLSSTSNQDDTECDLETMGVNLANEVKTFLKDWYNGIIFKKISFIGHSLGGLIIRSSLPHLKEYSNKFFMYMSLSSPHLGYTYSSSKIIDAGMWFLKAWKKSKSLEQISSTDGKNIEESYLYKLSNSDGLNWFSHVILISSHQDYYAPFESTRLQVCDKVIDNNDEKSKMYKTMASNIVSKVKKDSLRRIDVNFVIPDKNIDSFIGRTAHIQFLENQNFMKILFHYYRELLK